MERYPIIALIGASGSGKTTLMLEVMKRLPELVFPVKSVVTRAWRGPEDDIFCKFTTAEQILAWKEGGQLVQYLEYGGNLYGSTWMDMDWALTQGFGIQAYVEQGISDLRKAGLEVIPVKIVSDKTVFRDDLRIRQDQERAKIPMDYRLEVLNSFEVGGLESATEKLVEFILKLQKGRS